MPDWRAEWRVAAEEVVERSGGRWYFLIREVGGETILASGEDDVLHPASTIKVAIAALFFVTLEQEGPIEDLPKALRERGTDGRSYEQLLRAMLVKSEEPAADSLQKWVEERGNPEDALKSWGLEHTRLTPRRSTLNDLAMLLEGVWAGEWISAPARDILLGLMAEYTPNDDLRLGVARGCQAQGERLYNKRGTLTDDVLIVGDVALIERGEKWYFSGVFAYQTPEGQPQTTYEALEAGMADFGGLFCEFLGAGR